MIEPAGRPDWFVWRNPPAEWCRLHAEVPGLQWAGGDGTITSVLLHRSHLPLVDDCGSLAPTASSPFRVVQALAARGVELRGYQIEDLPFLVSRKGALLAYEMRLGKSVLACAAHNPADGPLVVVGPLAAREVWREWIEKAHGAPPFILRGRTVEAPPFSAGAYFVHYDVLEAWTEFFAGRKIGTLVIDEAHYLQSRGARRTHAMSVLAVKAERILALTGTPMWNSPDSMYSLLHHITPGAWGNHFDFAKRYAGATPGAHGWTYKHSSNEDELHARLEEIMIRRTWADVASDLPPTTRVIELVAVAASAQIRLEALATEATLINHGNTVTTAGYLATLRRQLADCKVVPAVAAAHRAMADGHKVVVWTWHNGIGDKIAIALSAFAALDHLPVIRLHASDSAGAREEKLGAFRSINGPAAIVIGIAVGGVAIDLSCADHAVFAELDWTPANVHQAEMRTFHPSRPHAVVYLVADIPVEMRLIEVLGVREGFQTALGLGAVEIARMVLDHT